MIIVDNCLWRLVIYTKHDFAPYSGFQVIVTDIGFHLKLGFIIMLLRLCLKISIKTYFRQNENLNKRVKKDQTFLALAGLLLLIFFAAALLAVGKLCRGVFSVNNSMWRLVIYTEHDFPLILGFKLSSQILVFTLNRDSRKGYLHTQWFSS